MQKTVTETIMASHPGGKMRLKTRTSGALTDEGVRRIIESTLGEAGNRMMLNEILRRVRRNTGPYQYRISEARILRILAAMAKRHDIYYVVIKAPDTK